MENGHPIQERSFGSCGLEPASKEGLLWVRVGPDNFKKHRNFRGYLISSTKTIKKGWIFEDLSERIQRRAFKKILSAYPKGKGKSERNEIGVERFCK